MIWRATSGAKKRDKSAAAACWLAARANNRLARSMASARISVTAAIEITLSNSAPTSTLFEVR